MTARRQQRGLTLVELLVAALMGSIVMGAVVQLLVVSSRHYARTETLAHMHEQAEVAIRFLRDDLRMAGHWGALRDATAIVGRARVDDVNPSGLTLPARCGPRFTTDLVRAVEVHTTPDTWGCRVTARPDSHALVLRFASAESFAPQANRLQITGDTEVARLTLRAQAPDASIPGASIRDLAVRGYYVAPRSSVFPDQPVLRRMTLNALTSGPRYIDEEITPGVEVLRLAAHIDFDNDGVADAVVPAGHAALGRLDTTGAAAHPPIALTIAVVVRSETARWRRAGAHTFELPNGTLHIPDDGYLRVASIATVRVRNTPVRL
ncbi:MAG: PilW family protein [Pseudomonadota bacterium]